MDRLEALKVFCRVVEYGGFSKAADRLGISTPSITKQVAALENHFNVKLLNRTTRRMSLTDEGRKCYEQALQLLDGMGELEDSLQQSHATPAGMLRIDMSTIISRLYVAPALPRFLAQYPDIRIKATINDRMTDLVDEGVDVSVRIGELADSNLIARPLCKTSYLCCASPEFIRKHGLPSSPEDLDLFPCLSFLKLHSRQPRPWAFEKDGEQLLYSPDPRIGIDHPESLIEATIAGGGIVQLLSVSVQPFVQTGQLVPVLEDWAAPGPTVAALYQQKNHQAAKIKVFVEFLQTLFQR
jgi:LysR family transcriptional regulator for bpeEF and oprC